MRLPIRVAMEEFPDGLTTIEDISGIVTELCRTVLSQSCQMMAKQRCC
jgi:hypothetical protein